MENENNCCSGSSCGCHIDVFPTDKKCPDCQGRLRLEGKSQRLEFHLSCQQCDYVSGILSREELGEVF